MDDTTVVPRLMRGEPILLLEQSDVGVREGESPGGRGTDDSPTDHRDAKVANTQGPLPVLRGS